MRLTRHTRYGQIIDFDPATGNWTASAPASPDLAVNGVGDVVGDVCVALVREGDGLFVYLGKTRFDVQDNYFYADSQSAYSESVFTVRDGRAAEHIAYPSWWTHTARYPFVFDDFSSAEDEDVCIYIAEMLRSTSSRRDMLNSLPGPTLAAAPPPHRILPPATYYQRIPPSRSTPSTVYRFFDDSRRAPERYARDEGWVPDKDLYLRQMSGVISAEDRISETRARQIVSDLGGHFDPPMPDAAGATPPGPGITGGYYACGPSETKEWHAGVEMRFVHWHYFRYFANGDWISCFRPAPFDFWAFTETIPAELLDLAKKDQAPLIGDYDPLCSAGTYTIHNRVLFERGELCLGEGPSVITRPIRDGKVFFGSEHDMISNFSFVVPPAA